MGRGCDTGRAVWKAVGDVSGRPGSRAGLRRRGRADRSTRAKGLPARGTRRQPAPRPPRPVHGPRRPLAPAHSTSHDARSFAPKRTPLAAARWERARGAAGHRFRHTTLGSGATGSGSESTRRCRTKPATSSAAAVPQHQAASSSAQRPHHHGNGGPALPTRRRAESSRLLRWFQHAAAETGTASSGARGSHRQPVHGERQKAARWRGDRTAPPLHTAAAATAAATARRCREPSTATAAEPGERRRSPTATAGPQRQRRFPEATHSGPESGARRTRPATAALTEPRTADQTGNESNGLLETL